MKSKREPLFIASGPLVLKGDEAMERLRVENDERFVVENFGIPKVDDERWSKAQEAEHAHWSGGVGRWAVADDRNFVHMQRYADYEVLRGKRFRRALEIGCGPYTNLRLISSRCKIDSCTLLDPLLMSYLPRKDVYYDAECLYVPPAMRLVPRIWPRVPKGVRRGCVPKSRRVAVDGLIAQDIEDADAEFPAADLVVMINVIEHCRDAHRVIEAVRQSLAPNGVLVVSEKCYDAEVVSERAALVYDQAHPLRITKAVLSPILEDCDLLYESSVLDRDLSKYLPGTYERYWILSRRGR